MPKVARIMCAKCRKPFMWVRDRGPEHSGLIDKCRLLGIEVVVAGEDTPCPACGQRIRLSVEAFEEHAAKRGVETDGGEGRNPKPDR